MKMRWKQMYELCVRKNVHMRACEEKEFILTCMKERTKISIIISLDGAFLILSIHAAAPQMTLGNKYL
jgi:hypothetical protein